MKIKGATTVLNIVKNPYAMPIKVIEAYKVYNDLK